MSPVYRVNINDWRNNEFCVGCFEFHFRKNLCDSTQKWKKVFHFAILRNLFLCSFFWLAEAKFVFLLCFAFGLLWGGGGCFIHFWLWNGSPYLQRHTNELFAHQKSPEVAQRDVVGQVLQDWYPDFTMPI